MIFEILDNAFKMAYSPFYLVNEVNFVKSFYSVNRLPMTPVHLLLWPVYFLSIRCPGPFILNHLSAGKIWSKTNIYGIVIILIFLIIQKRKDGDSDGI